MDPPPPSQSQSAPKTTLFSNPDGTPIRVFTQADLFGRAKVLKDLRLNGAELLSDASNAQIMLVDPPTRQGRQFIRDWGQDDNKTLLHYGWVKICLDAKRPLLAEDQWGNNMAQDDGHPIDAGESLEDDDVVRKNRRNPLPTPRVTPEELARMHIKRSSSRQASVSTRSQVDEVSMEAPTPPPSMPVPPDVTPSQPLPPAGMSTMAGMNPFMFMQNPAANLSPSMLAFTAQATQAMMANMFANVNANMMPNQQQPSFANNPFMLALQDSMRNAVAAWPGMQPQNGTFHASQSVSPLPEPPVPYPPAPSRAKRPQSPSLMSKSEPSVSRRVSSVSEYPSQRGKSKETSPPLPVKRRRVSSPSLRDLGASHPADSQPSNKKLFHTKNGRPLGFFVQIEIHNRFKLVSSIKKNGGVIVDTPTLADYAILYAGNQKQKVFKTLLQATHNADVPAVQAKFLYDCLSKGKVLDPTNYLYEPEFKQKLKRSVSRASIESESESESEGPAPKMDDEDRKRLGKNERERERKKMQKEQEAKRSATPVFTRTNFPKARRGKSVDVAYPRATDGPRTPSPPPEYTREPCPQGYKFSRAEDDFALRFAKILIDRDYTISQSAVISAIHKKLPHHSLGSWRNHFNAIASEWDTWRKRASIAYRKAQLQKQATVATSSTDFGPMEVVEIEESPMSYEDLEHDMEAVVRFFVEGNDRDQSEDESVVWQRLEAKASCRTESSWEIFYEKHAQTVIGRYNTEIG